MPRRVQKRELTSSQRWGIWAGYAGALLLVVAGLLYYREPLFNWWVKSALIAGILCLAAWISLAGNVIGDSFRGRSWLREVNGAAFVLAVVFIFAVLNFISNRRHAQWDLTKSGKFTLASLSQAVARKVDKPVTVTAFYSTRAGQAAEMRRTEDLLKQYTAQNDKIKVKVVDPFVDPKAARDKNIKSVPTLLFESEDGKRQEIANGQEKEITGALLKLTTKEKKKVYFLQGHGELDPDGFQPDSGLNTIKQALTEQQHDVAKLNLFGKGKSIPADAAAVVIAGPRLAPQPDEVKALQSYLNDGGHVLVMVGPRSPDLHELLQPWGLSVGPGEVVDMLAVQSATTPAVIAYESHDITRDLGNMVTAFPAARPINIAKTPPAGVVSVPLMKTSDNSWVEMNPNKIQYDGKDIKGPVTLAAVATKDLGSTPPPTPGSPAPPKTGKEGKIARLVVFGSVDFATNYWTQARGIANPYLVLNTVNWLAEEPALVNIPPKDDQPERVTLSDSQLRTLQLFNFIAIPALALLAGIVVWWKRR
jgi:ABC-type uncharacterized transport system involved in gliding motility auxiliary subunit